MSPSTLSQLFAFRYRKDKIRDLKVGFNKTTTEVITMALDELHERKFGAPLPDDDSDKIDWDKIDEEPLNEE